MRKQDVISEIWNCSILLRSGTGHTLDFFWMKLYHQTSPIMELSKLRIFTECQCSSVSASFSEFLAALLIAFSCASPFLVIRISGSIHYTVWNPDTFWTSMIFIYLCIPPNLVYKVIKIKLIESPFLNTLVKSSCQHWEHSVKQDVLNTRVQQMSVTWVSHGCLVDISWLSHGYHMDYHMDCNRRIQAVRRCIFYRYLKIL